MALEIVCVTDSELARLAKEGGSRSTEARIVKQLRKRRAQDSKRTPSALEATTSLAPFPMR